MQKWTAYRGGYVRIQVFSRSPERFLNLCAYHRIQVWKLTSSGQGYEMNVSVKDFLRLKGICRKTGTAVKIKRKYGLPFFFYRNKKRKAFFMGVFLSLCILFCLSRHIWNIHVEGNQYNSTQSILEYLEELQVRHGVLKKQVDCAALAQSLRTRFPDITWVSAKISGTRLLLEIKENGGLREKTEQEKTALDLVSDKEGLVAAIVTRKGTPLKKAGDFCKKDEILVSGRLDLYNDSREIVKYEYTQADADVYVQYSMEYYQEFSMNYEKPVYTGEKKKGYVFQAGSYYGEWKGKPSWKKYDTVTELGQVRLTENFKLPLFFGTSTDYAYENRVCAYTREEAESKARNHLKQVLEHLKEQKLSITDQEISMEISEKTCRTWGTLTVVEKMERRIPSQILEQPVKDPSDS